jgi:hypothetical protein
MFDGQNRQQKHEAPLGNAPITWPIFPITKRQTVFYPGISSVMPVKQLYCLWAE